MTLYVGDVSPTTIPIVISTALAADVVRVVVRSFTPAKLMIEWDMTPASSTATTVTLLRVLEAGDLPIAAPQGYVMRAWCYDSGDALIFTTDEFQGPAVFAQHVTPPT